MDVVSDIVGALGTIWWLLLLVVVVVFYKVVPRLFMALLNQNDGGRYGCDVEPGSSV